MYFDCFRSFQFICTLSEYRFNEQSVRTQTPAPHHSSCRSCVSLCPPRLFQPIYWMCRCGWQPQKVNFEQSKWTQSTFYTTKYRFAFYCTHLQQSEASTSACVFQQLRKNGARYRMYGYEVAVLRNKRRHSQCISHLHVGTRWQSMRACSAFSSERTSHNDRQPPKSTFVLNKHRNACKPTWVRHLMQILRSRTHTHPHSNPFAERIDSSSPAQWETIPFQASMHEMFSIECNLYLE